MTTAEPSGASAATPEPRRIEPHDPRLFINRELSWLEFNQRVLDEAADPSLSIPERLKFLGIVGSNLDEFFMVRVAGLKRQIASGVTDLPADGVPPAEQLRLVSERVHRMTADHQRVWRDALRPALAAQGVRLVAARELAGEERQRAKEWFDHKVVPLLTPLANDRTHPFPQLRNKSISIAVHLPRPSSGRRRRAGSMAVVGVPQALRRLVPIGPRTYVLIEDLVAEHAGELFPGNPEVRTAAFRVTRNWDLALEEEEGEDLVEAIQQGVRARDRGAPVRLELAGGGSRALTAPLADQLGLDPLDVYELDGPLQLQDLAVLADDLADGRRPPKPAALPRAVADAEASVLDAIAREDVLLHHPYDSFDPVVRFVDEAADDPDVKVIRQVLYRTGPDSPFVRALLRAAENGKEVAVFLEIKARFEEKNNIGWIHALKNAGAIVVYGYDACKTHCKIALVTRQEGDDLRSYAHIGTGNYNPVTARQYTDVSLLTARPELCADVQAVFAMLTANSSRADLAAGGSAAAPWPWTRLGVAPHDLQKRVLDLVAEEAEHARAGRPARLVAKMNSLVDPVVIRALYAASQAGVRVDLLVRGICCLRPGLAGVSDRIRVHQVVDRYLEHSRIFAFGEGRRLRVFLSSADWMPRNFHRRVEVMAPVEDPAARARLLEILEAGLADDAKGSRLLADGRYERLRPPPGAAPLRSQDALDPARRAANQELRAVPAAT